MYQYCDLFQLSSPSSVNDKMLRDQDHIQEMVLMKYSICESIMISSLFSDLNMLKLSELRRCMYLKKKKKKKKCSGGVISPL